MRGRGGGEGGLGTISSELLLWVSMAGETRGEGRLETQVTILNTLPTLLLISPRSLSQPPHCHQKSNSGAGTQSQETWDFPARLGK